MSAQNVKTKRPPWQDNRALIIVSLVLGVIVWLVFAFVNGDREDHLIRNVPLQPIDLTGTIADDLNLQPFFPGDIHPEDIRVSVVVSARRYDNITWEDVNAQLSVEDVNMAGDFNLRVNVTHARPGDVSRFEIKNYYIGGVTSQKVLGVVFDVERTLPFELVPTVIGEVQVPEGSHAEELMLSKKYVSITGPQRKLASIARVLAEIEVKEPLEETAVYKDIKITPVDANGNAIPQFLVIEGSVNATLPVWKIATLRSVADFVGAPEAYYASPLHYTITPSAVRAASANIEPDQSFSVGTIDFASLSPGSHTKTFLAKDMTQIAFLDGTERFTVRVDLAGMAERALRLPAGNITPVQESDDTPKYTASFRDIQTVTVVGPEDILAELTPENLAAEAVVTDGALPGANSLEARVRVVQANPGGETTAHPSCWVYGKYTVSAVLSE